MSPRFRWAFAAVVALQLLVLMSFVGFKEFTLRFGQTVVLQTVPVDARDFFRGDYVVLRYQISTLRSRSNENIYLSIPYDIAEGDTVYARLEPMEGVWRAIEVQRKPRPAWDVFIKGEVTRVTRTSGVRGIEVEYGIESYFVPEGQGREIERSRDVQVRVSVNGFGDPVIKGLVVDGEPWTPR